MTFPRKGSTVHCWYTGSLEDGTVFDSNQGHGGFKKLRQPLSFKIGANKVIAGWVSLYLL
jgi:FK506-binding protein 3